MATDVSKMESTTIKTYLGYSEDGLVYHKLVSIKDFPDLGGSPDQVEITDLEDEAQRFLNGVQSMSAFEFLSNYTKANYELLKSHQDGTLRKYCISFGETGEYGIFTWEGQLSVWVVGGGVNAAREMRTSISPSSKVELNSTATFSKEQQQ